MKDLRKKHREAKPLDTPAKSRYARDAGTAWEAAKLKKATASESLAELRDTHTYDQDAP